MLFQVFLNENQRVAQLQHLFWCAAKQFQVLLNENQRVAQLLALVFVFFQDISNVVI